MPIKNGTTNGWNETTTIDFIARETKTKTMNKSVKGRAAQDKAQLRILSRSFLQYIHESKSGVVDLKETAKALKVESSSPRVFQSFVGAKASCL